MRTYKTITTKDGSKSLFFPELDETYHSKFGAKTESLHVFMQSGYDFISKKTLSVLEIGFGTGLNTYLTYLSHLQDNREIYYETLEKYPLPTEINNTLNYSDNSEQQKYFDLIHQVEWNLPVRLSDRFWLCKKEIDLIQYQPKRKFDLVFFDAFAPDKQPEMWTEQIFDKLYKAMNTSGVLVTYSAKGSVRRTLQSVGFNVERIPGPPGKREMLRAIV